MSSSRVRASYRIPSRRPGACARVESLLRSRVQRVCVRVNPKNWRRFYMVKFNFTHKITPMNYPSTDLRPTGDAESGLSFSSDLPHSTPAPGLRSPIPYPAAACALPAGRRDFAH